MLETEEVDDDYFTPVTNTTLAGIFGKPVNSENAASTTSLKYTPPKPQENNNKPDDSKQSNCVFACALVGYEWFNNVYTAKGKLGFAIVKLDNSKSTVYSMVLYNANKTTLSSALVTKDFKITVKNNRYVSYYDNLRKYWSLYGTEDEVKKIAELLRDISATVEYALDAEEGLHKMESLKFDLTDNSDKASDIDNTGQNKKTKMSILNRMASMGQSVLPQQHNINIITSSSSESDNDSTPVSQHRPPKKTVKHHNIDKNISNAISTVETHKNGDTKLSNNTLYSYVNGQLVPVINNEILNTSSQDSKEMNLFIYEQKMNNSELRINMNRMVDKLDQVVNTVKDLGNSSQNSGQTNFQYEILQKLLVEYENKIKSYEEQLKSTGTGLNSAAIQIHSKVTKDVSDKLANKIIILEDMVNEKDNEISQLQEELKEQKIKLKHEIDNREESKRKQLIEISMLKEELSEYKNKFDSPNSSTQCDAVVESRIKKIMNDTFKGISINFDNNESYSGEMVKSIVVSVIKNVTMESLK